MSTATAQEQLTRYAATAWQPADCVEIRCLANTRGAVAPVIRWTTGKDLPGLYANLDKLNRAGFNVYAGILPRKAQGNGKAGTDDDVDAGRIVWADFDGLDPDAAWAAAKAAGLPIPSMGINSGHGAHLFWALTERTDAAMISALVGDMAVALGSDTTVKNPSRILRLPGFRNHKTPVADADLIYADPARRYAFATLRAIVPVAKRQEAPPAAADAAPGAARVHSTGTADALTRAQAYADAVPGTAEGGRNQAGFKLAATLTRGFALGDSADAGRIFDTWNRRNSPPMDAAEARAVLADGYKHGEEPIGARLTDRAEGRRGPATGQATATAAPAPPSAAPVDADAVIQKSGKPARAAVSEGGKATAAGCDSVPVLVNLSTVQPMPVNWLWPGRIAIGKLTLLAGDPGLGKSFITLNFAGRVSCGVGWPDAPELRSEPAGVVLLSAEDDLADTIRPRLDAAGAKADRIAALHAVRRYDETGAERAGTFNLADDLQALELAIGQVPNCRLVILDPISAYLGGEVDSHRNSDIRALLSPLADLAARRGVAVLAVTHLRKGEGPSMYRATGSLAFVAAARAVYVVARDKEDLTGERRFMLPVKNNLGADRNGLAYRLVMDAGAVPFIAWEPDPVTITADEALEAARKRLDDDGDSARKEAADWLRAALADGPVPAAEIIRRAKADGLCKRTLDSAKGALGVRSRKGHETGAAWNWCLPDVEDCKGGGQ